MCLYFGTTIKICIYIYLYIKHIKEGLHWLFHPESFSVEQQSVSVLVCVGGVNLMLIVTK